MGNKKEVTPIDATEASVLDETPIEEPPMTTSADSKFQELLNKTMTRRWNITAIVLTTFLFTAIVIPTAINKKVVNTIAVIFQRRVIVLFNNSWNLLSADVVIDVSSMGVSFNTDASVASGVVVSFSFRINQFVPLCKPIRNKKIPSPDKRVLFLPSVLLFLRIL